MTHVTCRLTAKNRAQLGVQVWLPLPFLALNFGLTSKSKTQQQPHKLLHGEDHDAGGSCDK